MSRIKMDISKKYAFLFTFCAIFIPYIKCDGELVVIRQPEDLRFYDNRPLYNSELKYLFGTCMGYLAPSSKEWQDIHINHPFDYNKVVIIVAEVPGVQSLNLTGNLTIPLMEDEPLEETFKQLNMKTTTIFTDYPLRSRTKRFYLEKIDLSESDVISSPLLDSTYKLYDVIIHELQKEKIHSGSTLFWAVYPEFNETDQEYFDTARILAHRSLSTFYEAVKDKYHPLVILITHDNKISLTRRKRQAMDIPAGLTEVTDAPIDISSLNLAEDYYDEDFPAIFNIMLWFNVSLLFSVIAICLVFANMDPGRDSIIYRMTSTRMKKDS